MTAPTPAPRPGPEPWPVVRECYWPAPSLVKENHSCAQCDGSHDHDWVAWHGAEHPFPGWSVTGKQGGPGIPVRCKVCGGRKCDHDDCLLRRHHRGPHEQF